MYTLQYSKWTTSQDLSVAHGTLLNVASSLGGRGVWGRMDTCICMAETLHCSPETTSTLFIGIPQYKNVFAIKKKIAYLICCLATLDPYTIFPAPPPAPPWAAPSSQSHPLKGTGLWKQAAGRDGLLRQHGPEAQSSPGITDGGGRGKKKAKQ